MRFPNCGLHHKRDLSKCLRCNYDLTGNTSGICPECGRPTIINPPDA